MAGQDIDERIEKLSEALVFAELSDLKSLADIHTQFEELGKWAEGKSQEKVVQAIAAATDIIENIILDEVDDPAASMEVVIKTVGSLQSILRDDRDPDEVEFPKELGIEKDREDLSESDVLSGKAVDGTEVLDENAGKGETAAKEAKQSEPSEQKPAEPKPLEGDLDLLGDFVGEALEHLEGADVHLLTIETDPKNDEALNSVFRAFHTIKGVSGFLALDEIGSIAHTAENLLDKARKSELELAGTAIDVTFDAVDMLKDMVGILRGCIESGAPLPGEPLLPALVARINAVIAGDVGDEGPDFDEQAEAEGKRIGEILVESGAASQDTVNKALLKQSQSSGSPSKLGELLVKEGDVQAKEVAKALRVQKGGQGTKLKDSVKVDAERLDHLVDMIGELVIAESMVCQSDELKETASEQLSKNLSQLDKITRELQEIGTSLRMMPIKPIFQKMARLSRDLSRKAGKRIEFSTTGEDTELDKTVIDKIGDPLVHMVRNAVDHGIETTDERVKSGKSKVGHVELRAYHKGGNIYIEIEDNGRGIDSEIIMAKAVERGLVESGDKLSEREVFSLLFLPGFSTAKKVTDVSGRGVGMDVVKRNIDSLGGHVEIRSKKGKGSVFTIRLPLTLAIIDGMVVKVASERYIIPTLSITSSMRPTDSELETVLNKGEMLSLQGELIPLFRLGRLFGLEGANDNPTEALVVIVEGGGKRTALLTDEILGQQQIVIKTLGESMKGISGISGGAIMADGRVGLILDVEGLVRLAHMDESAFAAQA